MQDAVDPEPDDDAVFLRLEVDVAGPVLGGRQQDRVDHPDDRPVRDAVFLLEVGDLVVAFELLLFVERLDDGLGRAVHPVELDEDLVAGGDPDRELETGGEAELVDRVDVLRVGERDVERLAVQPVRERHRAAEHVQRHEHGRFGGDAELA